LHRDPIIQVMLMAGTTGSTRTIFIYGKRKS